MNSWFKIENKAGDTAAKMYLYDNVGSYGITAHNFMDELSAIESDTIDVHINSYGGEVVDGFAIYQALKNHPATINVTVDALAASIASVIAMAGDTVKMAPKAELMIHDGHVNIQGNAAQLSKMVDTLERVSNNIASVYADRAGGEVADWRNAMQQETWFSAEEAVKYGLADEIVKSSPKTPRNIADLTIFNYAGRAMAPEPVLNADKTPYGDVQYADPGYQNDGQKRYPIDTADHCRAAWSYINQSDNASKYTAEQLADVKARIMKAAKKFGIEISNVIDTQSLITALKENFHG